MSEIVKMLERTILYTGHGEASDLPEQAASHITALEARVGELEAIVEQLAGTYLRDSNGGRDNFAPGGHDVARLVHLARTALNQEKQTP